MSMVEGSGWRAVASDIRFEESFNLAASGVKMQVDFVGVPFGLKLYVNQRELALCKPIGPSIRIPQVTTKVRHLIA